jgi:nitrogen regulatory protein PII
MQTLQKTKLITCFLEKDHADQLADYLFQECGIDTSHFAHARGQCSSNHNAHLWKERDILHIVVTEEQADEVFEKIYFHQELDKHSNGFIFQEELMLSSRFVTPEFPAEAVEN